MKRVLTVCLAGGTQDRPQTPEEVIAVVDGVFGTSAVVIQRRGRHGNSARDAAMLLCRELLDVPASQLATVFGVSPSGLSMTVQRAGERQQSDAEFARSCCVSAKSWDGRQRRGQREAQGSGLQISVLASRMRRDLN